MKLLEASVKPHDLLSTYNLPSPTKSVIEMHSHILSLPTCYLLAQILLLASSGASSMPLSQFKEFSSLAEGEQTSKTC